MAEMREQMSGPTKPPKFTDMNDLCSSKVGGKILFATDEWFAAANNLLKDTAPEWQEGIFTEYGKWMDGWETRRKRIPGHDWCIIKLGIPGVIHGIDADTSHFKGNYVPKISIQAARLAEGIPVCPEYVSLIGSAATPEQLTRIKLLESEKWTELLPMSSLKPGYKDTCHNYYPISNQERWTHIRLNIYPDGGVARLHVYGVAQPDWSAMRNTELLNLLAMENGGLCIGYSDAHFGHPRNLTSSSHGVSMGDGWETARRLDRPPILVANRAGVLQFPGNEWCVFRLGHPGVITKIEIDTNHFKGNYPDSCTIHGCYTTVIKEEEILQIWGKPWKTILSPQKLSANKEHCYSQEHIHKHDGISHIRVIMAPDGGISRIRIWGHICKIKSTL